jgi:hypothetical protein
MATISPVSFLTACSSKTQKPQTKKNQKKQKKKIHKPSRQFRRCLPRVCPAWCIASSSDPVFAKVRFNKTQKTKTKKKKKQKKKKKKKKIGFVGLTPSALRGGAQTPQL